MIRLFTLLATLINVPTFSNSNSNQITFEKISEIPLEQKKMFFDLYNIDLTQLPHDNYYLIKGDKNLQILDANNFSKFSINGKEFKIDKNTPC